MLKRPYRKRRGRFLRCVCKEKARLPYEDTQFLITEQKDV